MVTFCIIYHIIAGQRVVVVRCEELNISGSFYRNKCKFAVNRKLLFFLVGGWVLFLDITICSSRAIGVRCNTWARARVFS